MSIDSISNLIGCEPGGATSGGNWARTTSERACVAGTVNSLSEVTTSPGKPDTVTLKR